MNKITLGEGKIVIRVSKQNEIEFYHAAETYVVGESTESGKIFVEGDVIFTIAGTKEGLQVLREQIEHLMFKNNSGAV